LQRHPPAGRYSGRRDPSGARQKKTDYPITPENKKTALPTETKLPPYAQFISYPQSKSPNYKQNTQQLTQTPTTH